LQLINLISMGQSGMMAGPAPKKFGMIILKGEKEI
jgi:hypothetical protein